MALSALYSTNAGATVEGTDDVVFRVRPSVFYQTVGALIAVRAEVGVEVVRYLDLTENDSENLVTSFSVNLPRGVDETTYNLGFNLGVREETEANFDLGGVTRTRNYEASIRGGYRFSPLFWLNGGVSYGRSEALGDLGEDSESFSIPVSIGYVYSELLRFFAGYRVRWADSLEEGGNEFLDHAVFIGADGTITPLVTGRIEGWVQIREDRSPGGETWTAPYAAVGIEAGSRT